MLSLQAYLLTETVSCNNELAWKFSEKPEQFLIFSQKNLFNLTSLTELTLLDLPM